MRVAVAAFVLLVTAAAVAQRPVGSQEPGPAPGQRYELTGASSRNGHLAVWLDGRAADSYWYMAARIGPGGNVLDPAGIPLMRNWPQTISPILVASDGEDWLVVTRAGSVRVRADGTVAPAAFRHNFPRMLAWNGSAYLVIDGVHGVLLDREGTEISGTVRFPDLPMAVTGHDGRWLVATQKHLHVLTAADFPRVGVPADAPSSRAALNGQGHVALTADAIGFVSVRATSGGVMVQRHAGDGRALLRPVFYRTGRLEPFTVRAFGGALYLSQPSSLLRLARGVIEDATPPGSGSRTSMTPLMTSAGALVAWQDGSQLYATPLGVSEAPVLISRARARQRTPRLVSGAGIHLAVWGEEHGGGEQVAAVIVDDDGRPRSGVLALGSPVDMVYGIAAASDGAGFLIVWYEYVGDRFKGETTTRAAIVTASGDAVHPVAVPPSLAHGSVVWDGTSYVIGAMEGVMRVTAGGIVLDPAVREMAELYDTGATLLLVRDGDSLRGVVLGPGSAACSADMCVWYDYSFVTLGRDLRITSMSEEPVFRAFQVVALAAIAAGGGRTYAAAYTIRDEYVVISDAGTAGKASYGLERMPHRLHAAWNGKALLVAAGPVLAEHDIDGKQLRARRFTAQANETAIAIDALGSALLLSEEPDAQNMPRLWLRARQ